MDGILPGEAFIDGNAGATTQALGTLAAHDWLHGIVPWWNPYSGIGLPLAGEMQPAAFFLPFLFLLLLPAGLICLKMALQGIAGCATFALLRQLNVAPSAALAGGIIFELNGTFAWLGDAPMLPVAFLPLLLLGIERAAAAALGGPGGWRWIAVAIGYSLLAGFPETAYLDGLFALAWAVWRGAGLPRAARAGFIVRVGAGGLLGLLVSAPLLNAFADFLGQAYVGGHVDFAGRVLTPPNLAMLMLPYVAGTVGNHLFWFTIGGYIGAPVLLLAIMALLHRPDPIAPRTLMGIWLAIGVAAAAGVPGITEAVQRVPLVRNCMLPNYISPSWSMAASVLAALAIDDWCKRRPDRRIALVAYITVVSATALALLVSRTGLTEVWGVSKTGTALGVAAIVWAALLTSGLFLLLCHPPSRSRRVLLCGMIALDATVMFSVPLLGGTKRPPLDSAALSFLRDHLGLGRFASAQTIQPNYGAMFGLASVNALYLPNDRAWVDHVISELDPGADEVNFPGTLVMLQRHSAAFAAMGVRYAVVPLGAKTAIGVHVFRSALTDIYALPNPAPYYDAGPDCELSEQTRLSVSVRCRAASTLVRRELYMPGWTAEVDGLATPLGRHDGLIQAVKLTPGSSLIRFSYRPPGTGWADVAMVFGLVIFATSFVWRRNTLPRALG